MAFDNRKPRILFIEDDMTLTEIYTIRMQTEGFEVMAMHDGESALQVAKSYKPDLILCDLMMPSLSGYDIVDILRNTVETSLSKIVVMSALGEPDDINKAKTMGADDFIVKSQTTVEEVIERLRSQLGLPPAAVATS